MTVLATCEYCGKQYGHPGPCPCQPLFGHHIWRALDLAIHVHRYEWRRGNLPYISHIFDCMRLLAEVGVSPDDFTTYQLAILHDVVESGCDPEEVAKISTLLRDRVLVLSFRPVKGQGRRHDQKARYILAVAQADVECLVVKIVDRINNIRDFLRGGDVAYANEYMHKADPLWQAFEERKDDIVSRYGATIRGALGYEIAKVHSDVAHAQEKTGDALFDGEDF